MKVEVSKIRPAYQNAKKAFANSWKPPYGCGFSSKFWKDFGDANNMKIVIDRFEAGLPKISWLEFNSEKDFAWFMLRWS